MSISDYFVLAAILFAGLIWGLFFFLQKKDLQIDYTNSVIKRNVRKINGTDYLIVPYLMWQQGKLNEIKKRYSVPCEINGKLCTFGIAYDREPHDAKDKLINGLYRDYIVEIIPMEKCGSTPAPSPSYTSYTQNIGVLYGTANLQGSGSIVSNNITHAHTADAVQLIVKIIPSLDFIPCLSREVADDVRDTLESIAEQIASPLPKKSRLQKSLKEIKNFIADFSGELTITQGTIKVTETEWIELANRIEQLISTIK